MQVCVVIQASKHQKVEEEAAKRAITQRGMLLVKKYYAEFHPGSMVFSFHVKEFEWQRTGRGSYRLF